MKLNLMRYKRADEVLGGDVHYFGPIKFEGSIEDYELKETIKYLLKENMEFLELIN
jgi:hypothetical protein